MEKRFAAVDCVKLLFAPQDRITGEKIGRVFRESRTKIGAVIRSWEIESNGMEKGAML
jgi:hypothetical protein